MNIAIVLAAPDDEKCRTPVARMVSLQGVVEYHRPGKLGWHQATPDSTFCVGDKVRVRANSRAALRLSNETILRLDQSTVITIAGPDAEQNTLLDLMSGVIHVITRTPKPFKIRTPVVNASVDGTEFLVDISQENNRLPKALIVVYEGKVNATNPQGSLLLTSQEAAIIHEHQPPRKEIMIHPLDAVQWALHYPTLINYRPDANQANLLPPEIRNAISYYQQGKPAKALAELDHLTAEEHTVATLLYRAGLLLTVGRVQAARSDLQQALQREPGNSDALAQQAIIAVVQNRKQEALALAEQAVKSNPASSAAKLALSYAQQAHFQIEAALASTEEVTRLDSQNALAWARLAELQMSAGQSDHALQSAEQAASLNPNLSRTQTVLGFAYLLQIDTGRAQAAFTRAITLDQADPMPRLGMGIARIRENKLEAGRIDIETAASLDPANSLIRSYLGKAYFEEKRYPLATTQFDLAKARDPNDPTPWLYDAIQKQTQNRPVEALHDIQKSIELNDNRAVHRSQLLLDQDQAARGSSLARIYDNLGFEQRALMETAKSLSFDPTNHSAHRFLSDAYATIPRHEIARVSELLQAQLLQPINVNPVQPQMAVADLNLITGTGPAALGFNEFTPLMERNKSQLVASGLWGNKSTFGNEIVFSKLYDRTSFSIGQFHYQTDGFRPNNDQKHNIVNAFIQHAFTPKLNVQAELRTRKTDHGDLLLNFDSDQFYKDKRRKLDQDEARLGARYSLSPKHDLIISTKFINRREKLFDQTEGFLLSTIPYILPWERSNRSNNIKNKGYSVQAQHSYRTKYFNSITGVGTYQFDGSNLEEITRNNLLCIINCDDTGIVLNDITLDKNTSRKKLESTSFYHYTNINYPNNFNAILGLSYTTYQYHETDKEDSEKVIKDIFNKVDPKFGLQWDIFDFLRLRLAWLYSTKRALIANQTVEPTQIAGFNQFFDDINGTTSRRRGAGLDGIFSKFLYGGIEISDRHLNVPNYLSIINNDNRFQVSHQDQKEMLYRAYIYWLPNVSWAVKGEFYFDKFTRDPNDTIIEYPTHISTFRIPLSIKYFHSSGFFSEFTSTFIKQDLIRKGDESRERNPMITNSGIDSFLLLDAAVGYRFLNRRGIFSIEGRNLLNEKFLYRNVNFYESEPANAHFFPKRTIFAKLTLNF